MPSAFDALLSSIISRATSEIAGAVRDNMAEEVLRAVKAHAPSAPGARAVPAAPPAQRKPRVVRVPAKKAVPARKRVKGERRSSVEVTQDDWILLEYVRAHAGQRGDEIREGAGLPKDRVTSGLQRLRKAGRVRIQGVKRGATYAAASRARPANGGDALLARVLALIAKTPGLRAEEITKRLGAKPEAVKAALASLREAGKVKVSGKARGTRYAVA